MNNPLRYRGETFFQSNYTPLPGGKGDDRDPSRSQLRLADSVCCLQHHRARNAGSLPGHIDSILSSVAYEKTTVRQPIRSTLHPSKNQHRRGHFDRRRFCAACNVHAGALVRCDECDASDREGREFDFYEAGKIPVQFGGRVMPLDAYATSNAESD